MEVTIHSVAEKANVSVSTASRILNGGTKGLRRDAAQRAQLVLDAARELGYQPNAAARGLVMKRTFSIGFIGTELDNPVRSKLIESLRQAALEKGFHLLVAGMRHNEDLRSALRNMMVQRVEGLILGNIQNAAKQLLPDLDLSGLPVVGFGQETGLPWDSVMIDYGGMIEKLVVHLIEKHGLRKIVFAGHPESFARQDRYMEVMQRFGFADQIKLWLADDWSLESGRVLAQHQIATEDQPDAIVCHNDLLAIGIIAGLRSCGLRVPEDVAVVGLDNIDIADFINPGLTSVGVDGSELADSLFGMLYDRINGKEVRSPRKVICRDNIFFRESCGCGK